MSKEVQKISFGREIFGFLQAIGREAKVTFLQSTDELQRPTWDFRFIDELLASTIVSRSGKNGFLVVFKHQEVQILGGEVLMQQGPLRAVFLEEDPETFLPENSKGIIAWDWTGATLLRNPNAQLSVVS